MDKLHMRLIPVTKWPDYYPWPSVSGLRHLIFHEKKNGFDRVVRRIGRRCLISEKEFHVWANNVSKGEV